VIEPGIGAGPLSAAAEERRRGSHDAVPVGLPDFDDHDAVRRWRAEINEGWGESDDPDRPHRPEELGGVRCLVAGASPGRDTPLIIYVHGGGYCLGSAAVAIPITARLALGGEVVSVDYRLAPEHPCPAAVHDVVAVCGAIGADREFALAGDSAGAGIALAAAQRLRDDGAPVPTALALFSPHLDHSTSRAQGEEAPELAALAAAYAGDLDPADPLVSPLRGDMMSLPPTLVQVAAGEPLLGQSAALSRRLRAAGVRCDLDVWAGLWHTWHYHRIPEADRALAEVAAFLAASWRLGN